MGPGPLDLPKKDWNVYQIRFQAPLDIARTTDDATKTNFLISSLGSERLKLLHFLVQPRQVAEFPYAELAKTLKFHFTPQCFKEFELAKLLSARQDERQSPTGFLAWLRSVISNYKFENEADTRTSSLLTAFIIVLGGQRLRAHLVQNEELSIEIAPRLSKSVLWAEKESRQLPNADDTHLAVSKVTEVQRLYKMR